MSAVENTILALLDRLPDWMQIFVSGDTLSQIIFNNILMAFGTIGIGWAVATVMEHRHNIALTEQEATLAHIKINTLKTAKPGTRDGIMLVGSTVISHDFFRTLIILIRRLIGGNIKPYERLLTRGRRAAIISLKAQAQAQGYTKVINVRFGSTRVATGSLVSAELLAYGTGVKS
ncbi:MAG: heavy metal-binding domain-containing protein [Kordiimonadaceae bacterium]|nr:heavy metal-binding domain-containing protein [Kordiimonadaceae bacterium]